MGVIQLQDRDHGVGCLCCASRSITSKTWAKGGGGGGGGLVGCVWLSRGLSSHFHQMACSLASHFQLSWGVMNTGEYRSVFVICWLWEMVMSLVTPVQWRQLTTKSNLLILYILYLTTRWKHFARSSLYNTNLFTFLLFLRYYELPSYFAIKNNNIFLVHLHRSILEMQIYDLFPVVLLTGLLTYRKELNQAINEPSDRKLATCQHASKTDVWPIGLTSIAPLKVTALDRLWSLLVRSVIVIVDVCCHLYNLNLNYWFSKSIEILLGSCRDLTLRSKSNSDHLRSRLLHIPTRGVSRD